MPYMNRFFIYNKIYEITCNKTILKMLMKYYIGKYAFLIVGNTYKIICCLN